MSTTNIRLEKVCLYCNKEFTAQKISTKYCSHKCNQRHYKIRKREEKVLNAKKEIEKKRTISKVPNYDKQKIFSIKETCLIIGIGRTTLYRWIKNGQIKATKIGGSVFISKKEIKKVFNL